MPERRAWWRFALGLCCPGLGLLAAGYWLIGVCCAVGVGQLVALGWADMAANTTTFDDGATYVRTHFVQTGGRIGAQAIWSFVLAGTVHVVGAWAASRIQGGGGSTSAGHLPVE